MLLKNKLLYIACLLLMVFIVNACSHVKQLIIDYPETIAAKTRNAGSKSLITLHSESELKLEIKFDFDSWEIKDESFVLLDSLAADMKNQEWVNDRFVIEGHTDSQGSSQYNQLLSQKRAEAVRNYLIKQGIHLNRLVAKGYGESRLLDKSNTEQAHGMNRRVVLNVLEPVNKKSRGDTRILVFANLIDANRRVKLNLSDAISHFQNLYKKVQIKEVVSFTNEDCTKNNVFKSLKKDENTVNIVFFIGDLLVGSDNELYFKTVDTDDSIIEYSALKLSNVIRLVNDDSFIVLPRQFSA